MRGILLSPEDPSGSMYGPIADGLNENGVDIAMVFPWSEWNFDSCNFVITFGPMYSIVQIVQRLAAMQEVPPLVMWFTEQLPPPNLPSLATNRSYGSGTR